MQLAAFAPDIIKLFNGSDKKAEIAEKVVGIARSVTGLEDPKAAADIIAANATKSAEFTLAFNGQQGDMEKTYLADVQSARNMQVAALGQDDTFSKRFVYYFAAAWSIFTMCYVVGITFYPPLSEAGKANSATVLGFLLGTAVASIFSYLFGSTKGSAEKSRLLAVKA